jgi:putative membrane protein
MTDDSERFEVDARFLLANERTLLAWQRTAFALVAGGVAAPQLGDDVPARGVLAALLLLSGLVVAVVGGVRFARADLAMRRGELPATGRAPYLVVGIIAMVAVVATITLIVG